MSVIKYMSVFTTFSVFIAFFSIVYQAFLSLKHLNKKTTILTGLLALENVSRVERPKIAIGYGACKDLLVNGTAFLNFTKFADSDSVFFDEISNSSELLQSFGYYFKNGAAAERFMSNDKLFREYVSIAAAQYGSQNKWSLGGNAPLMARRFYLEGADVLLGARMSRELKKELPQGIKLAGDFLDEDDVHLILEYKNGEKWGEYVTPRANRYILHNDKNNPHLSSIEAFDTALKEFQPNLLIISGIQMMDSYKFEKGVRESHIKKIQSQIKSQGMNTLIHFEMASYVEIAMFRLLLAHILPHADSIGMNEQELDNLKQVLEFGEIKFASDWNPRVATTLDQIRQVFQLINKEYFSKRTIQHAKRRMLSRIHVHTLAYQAILTVKGSRWNNTKNAAAKAALVANRYVCQNEIINPESAALIFDDSFATSASLFQPDLAVPKRIVLNPLNPVSCWEESLTILEHNIQVEFCVAPVLICKVVKKTAGAGDNVSAAGLYQQI